MAFLKDFFGKKLILKKVYRWHNSMRNYPAGKELLCINISFCSRQCIKYPCMSLSGWLHTENLWNALAIAYKPQTLLLFWYTQSINFKSILSLRLGGPPFQSWHIVHYLLGWKSHAGKCRVLTEWRQHYQQNLWQLPVTTCDIAVMVLKKTRDNTHRHYFLRHRF